MGGLGEPATRKQLKQHGQAVQKQMPHADGGGWLGISSQEWFHPSGHGERVGERKKSGSRGRLRMSELCEKSLGLRV